MKKMTGIVVGVCTLSLAAGLALADSAGIAAKSGMKYAAEKLILEEMSKSALESAMKDVNTKSKIFKLFGTESAIEAKVSLKRALENAEKSPKEAKAAAELISSIRSVTTKPSQEGGTMGASLSASKEIKSLEAEKFIKVSSFAKPVGEVRTAKATSKVAVEEIITAVQARTDVPASVRANAVEFLRLNPESAPEGLLAMCGDLPTENLANELNLLAIQGKMMQKVNATVAEVEMALATEVARYRRETIEEGVKDVRQLECGCGLLKGVAQSCAAHI